MLTDIVDKVVWVTGASSGIGAAAAIALSQAGAKVILSGRRAEKLRAIAADLDHETLVAPLDVSIAEDVTQVVDQIMAQYGRIDILRPGIKSSTSTLMVLFTAATASCRLCKSNKMD